MKSLRYTSTLLPQMLLLCLIGVSNGLLAQGAATLSVQGVLTKSDGTAVEDNVYTMTFRLWNDPNATDPSHLKYTETITDVETTGGVYSVVLGSHGQALDAKFDEVYWLGVSMNSSSVELLPRPRLTHAPYALGINGTNNKFGSVGPVLADAFRVKGGMPIGGQGAGANGYSFHTIGDDAGGMYSEGANNISLWAGGAQKIKLSNGLNELLGNTNTNALNVFGPLTSNDHTINGNSQVNGWEVVTGDERVEGNQLCNKKFLAKKSAVGGGYSFEDDGAYDTGLFGGDVDGECKLLSNGVQLLSLVSPSEIALGPGLPNAAQLRIFSNEVFINSDARFINQVTMPFLQPKPGGNIDPKNIAFDKNTGRLFWENSSRRYKHNIRPLVDDFSMILKAQPRIYNRYVDGVKDTLYNELGYVAEEMDSIGLHKLVEHDKDGLIDGFDYQKMILYVVEVLKTQDAAIKDLRSELETLKAQNAGLQTENGSLRAENGSLTQQQSKFSAQLESLSKRMQLLENTGSSGSKK